VSPQLQQASFSNIKLCTDFNAGVGVTEMLGRSNYIALVGGGKQPKFPQNKVGKPSPILLLRIIRDNG
jgi:hypothetical protein